MVDDTRKITSASLACYFSRRLSIVDLRAVGGSSR